jgi:hypothetical protein
VQYSHAVHLSVQRISLNVQQALQTTETRVVRPTLAPILGIARNAKERHALGAKK